MNTDDVFHVLRIMASSKFKNDTSEYLDYAAYKNHSFKKNVNAWLKHILKDTRNEEGLIKFMKEHNNIKGLDQATHLRD